MRPLSYSRPTHDALLLGTLFALSVGATGCVGMMSGIAGDAGVPADGSPPPNRDAGCTACARDGATSDGGMGDAGCVGCLRDGGGGAIDMFVMATCEGAGAPAPLPLDVMPDTAPDLIAPGRGVERWHDQFYVDVPTEGASTTPLDVYHRFSWTQFERSEGVYDWTRFDGLLHDAIAARQKLSFGINVYNTGVNFGGGISVAGAGRQNTTISD